MRFPVSVAMFAVAASMSGCAGPEEESLDDELAVDVGELSNDVPAPPPSGISFGRDADENVYGVRIYDARHHKPKVVFSARLSDLRSTEKLRVRGEVVLSRCNPKDIAGESGDSKTTPCDRRELRASPYRYAPNFSAAFVLGSSATDGDGPRLSAWSERRCPEAQHHCALALPAVNVDPPDAAQKFINLVVTADADGSNARSFDVMEVEQHKGMLQVIRIAPGAAGVVEQERSAAPLDDGPWQLDRPKEDGDPTQVRRKLYQVQVSGLKPGDVIEADAKIRVVLGNGFTCDPLITGEVYAAANPNADEARGPFDVELTAKNGANCADHSSDGCKYTKSGAAKVRAGSPTTMYVTYTALGVRSCVSSGDTWRLAGNDGFLEVKVRR